MTASPVRHFGLVRRFGQIAFAAAAAVSLTACGINSVPTAEENAKAKWADVESAYQRRADLVPNLVETALGQLRTVVENYPQLQSQARFADLMVQLEGTENRINVARTRYNEAVQEYNTTIRTFPDAIGAKLIHGAKPMIPFKADPAAATAPKVNFGAAPAAPAANDNAAAAPASPAAAAN